MKSRFLIVYALLAMFTFSACDESTEDLGSSLTTRVDKLNVSNQVFQVTSRSVSAGEVWSRSNVGYLGCVKDPETDSYIKSGFMSQFHLLNNFQLKDISQIASRDDAGMVMADSCEIRLFYSAIYGDSLATMKLTVYEMDHPMLEDQHYNTDFDPVSEGYVRTDGIRKDAAYTLINYSDNNRTDDDYGDNICVKLNDPYTAKNGVTYSNFGTYILRTYYEHPEYFKNTITFMKNVVPGFYFTHAGGIGSLAQVAFPRINIFYRTHSADTIAQSLTYITGSEEVLQTCHIQNDYSLIDDMIADNSCTYLKTPSGIYTELTLPVDEIYAGHDNDTINSAKLVLTRLNNDVSSDWSLGIPTNLLMVASDSLSAFFDSQQLADYKETFLSSYSSSVNGYTFSNISGLISHMAQIKKAGLAGNPNWVSEHPNWNKVLLVPITPQYRTTTSYYGSSTRTLTGITYDMSLSSTRLVGGSTPIELSVIYSKFNE